MTRTYDLPAAQCGVSYSTFSSSTRRTYTPWKNNFKFDRFRFPLPRKQQVRILPSPENSSPPPLITVPPMPPLVPAPSVSNCNERERAKSRTPPLLYCPPTRVRGPCGGADPHWEGSVATCGERVEVDGPTCGGVKGWGGGGCSTFAVCGGRYVGKEHHTAKTPFVGQDDALGPPEHVGGQCRFCVSFCSCHLCVPAGTIDVLQESLGAVSSPRFCESVLAESRSSAAGVGGGYTAKTGNAYSQRGFGGVGCGTSCGRPPVCTSGVENSQQVERSAAVAVGSVPCCVGRRGNCGLVRDSQGAQSRSVPAVQACSCVGGSRDGDRSFVPLASPIRGSDSSRHKPIGQEMEKGASVIFRSQYQKGCDIASPHSPGPRSPDPGGACVSPSKARSRKRSVPYNSSLRGGQSCLGQGFKDRGGDCAPIASLFSFDGGMGTRLRAKHSVTRRSHTSRLPQTPEEKAAPLHVASCIKPMDVQGLRLRLNAKRLARFDDVWRQTFYPSLPVCKGRLPQKESSFSVKHANMLVLNSVARKAPGPGPLLNVPFTVIEEKPSGLRQRFILWSKESNELLDESGYEADVPLKHVSHYLAAVREDVASARDFKTGFYQVAIPEDARHLFRFCCDDGSWLEMVRLPMGHSCAPEIMHTMAAAAAGDPEFVKPEFVPHGVVVHCWIDNIRFCGSSQDVRRASATLDKVANECRLTWKEADTLDLATEYEFLGVKFDHSKQTVQPSGKLLGKIAAVSLDKVTAGDLESLCGRLLHASAISGVSPGDYWFCLKFFRRVANKLNRLLILPSHPIVVPPSVRRELNQWRRRVNVSQRIGECHAHDPTLTVFVDASLAGWGGVIVNNKSGSVSVDGGAWSASEKLLHINVLEGRALEKTVRKLSLRDVNVRIFVDNTSVKGVVRKKSCLKDRSLNDAVMGAIRHLKSLSCGFSVQYVRSQDNPADLPSRVSPEDLRSQHVFDATVLAVRSFLTGDGVAA